MMAVRRVPKACGPDDWRQAARACIHLRTISLSYAVPNNLA